MATESEISSALAGVRRRARLLERANRRWSIDVVGWLVLAAIGAWMLWRSADAPSGNWVGLLFFVGGLAVARLRQLEARVDALTKLMTEVDYPDQA